MKQNLTFDDLKDYEFEKLKRIAIKFKEYENCFDSDLGIINLEKLAEKITIGRLIEVINSEFSIVLWHEGHAGWVVMSAADCDDFKWTGEDLCTVLWNVLKDDI